MPTAIVLSYWDLCEAASGGSRRVHALMNALAPHPVLVQPRAHHPTVPTVPYPRDLGRRKRGINWGIFNFYLPSTRRIARGLLSHQHPALAVMTSIWNEPALRRHPTIPVVLDAHDVNAVAIAERFGPTHPFTRLVESQERRAVERAHHVFACSEGDRQAFLARYELPEDRVSVVPNGVDVAAFDAVNPDEPDPEWTAAAGGGQVLLFMGKLDYQPNQAALDFLSDTLLPDLEARSPGLFRLVVCGGPLPAGRFHPAIHFAGRLPTARLQRWIKRADLCLAPVFTGSGTRLKILEYLAARRPVVSTPKGAEGLPCRSGRELLLADPDHFTEAVWELAGNPNQAAALGQAGHRFVTERFDWATSIQPRWRAVTDPWLKPTV